MHYLATLIQKVWKGHIKREHFLLMKRSQVVISSRWKGHWVIHFMMLNPLSYITILRLFIKNLFHKQQFCSRQPWKVSAYFLLLEKRFQKKSADTWRCNFCGKERKCSFVDPLQKVVQAILIGWKHCSQLQ